MHWFNLMHFCTFVPLHKQLPHVNTTNMPPFSLRPPVVNLSSQLHTIVSVWLNSALQDSIQGWKHPLRGSLHLLVAVCLRVALTSHTSRYLFCPLVCLFGGYLHKYWLQHLKMMKWK